MNPGTDLTIPPLRAASACVDCILVAQIEILGSQFGLLDIKQIHFGFELQFDPQYLTLAVHAVGIITSWQTPY